MVGQRKYPTTFDLPLSKCCQESPFADRAPSNLKKWSALKGAFVWAILPYLGSRLDTWYKDIVGQ